MLFKLHLYDKRGSSEPRSFIAAAKDSVAAERLADLLGKEFFPQPRVVVEGLDEHTVEALRHEMRYGASVIFAQWLLRRPEGSIESGFDIYTELLESSSFWRGREFPPDLARATEEALTLTSARVINGHGADFFCGSANKITEGVRLEDNKIVFSDLRSTIFAP